MKGRYFAILVSAMMTVFPVYRLWSVGWPGFGYQVNVEKKSLLVFDRVSSAGCNIFVESAPNGFPVSVNNEVLSGPTPFKITAPCERTLLLSVNLRNGAANSQFVRTKGKNNFVKLEVPLRITQWELLQNSLASGLYQAVYFLESVRVLLIGGPTHI